MEVSARARLVDSAGADPGLTATISRSEIEEALRADDGEAELLLDVARSSGNGEQTVERRQVAVGWGRDDLERLLGQAGERVTLAFDRESLEQAFSSEVEAHGIRETAAILTVAVAAAASGGAAQAALDEGGQPASAGDAYTLVENVRADTGAPAPDALAAVENLRAGRQAPPPEADAYAAIENVRAAPESAPDAYAAIENVRATPEAPDAYAAIENVRATPENAPGDAYASIENVRAGREAPEAAPGGGGFAVPAPDPAATAGLAAAAGLAILGAAFAVRNRRRPQAT
jgi:hypothetical protein